jgi:two-component system phosphate regulon sensor histidine kinase PhoR
MLVFPPRRIELSLLEPHPPMAPRRFDAPLWAVAAIGAMLAALAALAAASRPELAAGLAVLALLTSSGLTIALAIRRVAPAANRAPAGEAAAAPLPYAMLADALPDPILVISGFEPDDIVGRRYIFANRAARELLRLGRDSGPLISAIRDPEVLEAADEALFGRVEAECVYEIPGAQAKTLRAQARPLAVAADGTRQAILAFRDETELRSVERTRADFLANASHELRTPLASLSGFIETLRGHARQDEGARDRFLGIMQAQAERMSRLIDDLLSLSRIELNEHVAPGDEVDLALAVLEVVEAAAPLARLRGVNLKPELPARGVACIIGDRDQIIQVVQNLVDNALKYSPNGGTVRIRVQAGLSADQAALGERADAARLSLLTPDRVEGAYAVLQVIDEGGGIAREHLPRLTERFYRVEGQKSGERSGTGLGLAIVKHIANRHRGGLVVESAKGQGTTFTTYLPLKPGLAPPAVARVS